ncbi:MAG TPA: helix-turn-helix domain-containing protein [Megamonas funiformis]|nr:helix-turn-helix domain-containing protein [Megamonas funiformis]
MEQKDKSGRIIFAKNLKKYREKNGWTQQHLADILNVSRQAVSKWELASSEPDLDKISEISKLFNITVDDILENDVEKYKLLKRIEEELERKKEKQRKLIFFILTIIFFSSYIIYKTIKLVELVNLYNNKYPPA